VSGFFLFSQGGLTGHHLRRAVGNSIVIAGSADGVYHSMSRLGGRSGDAAEQSQWNCSNLFPENFLHFFWIKNLKKKLDKYLDSSTNFCIFA